MQQNGKKHITIRVEQETYTKFQHVCRYHYRSVSGQLVQLMKKAISDYEQEHEKSHSQT